MSKNIDNIIFGKEIKDLNFLNNPDYKPKMFREEVMSDSEKAKIHSLIKDNIEKYKPLLKSNIKYITKPIVQAWEANEQKLIDMMPERQNRQADSGVFIYKAPKTNINTTNYFHLDLDKGEVFFMVLMNGVLTNAGFMHDGDILYFNPFSLLTNGERSDNDPLDIPLELSWMLRHMDLDIKKLPKRRKAHFIDCIYENYTNNDIEVINSTYFRAIEKSGAFKVRGHFRLQPKKKDGEWTKELIWINEFQKNGYTAPARKLKDI